jgi:metallo-beta-lactamase class B
MVMAGDVPVVESGGREDFQYGNDKASLYPPAKVDRVLRDGDRVELGGAVLVARLTAGHTKGCTTWTMTVKDGAKSYEAVIVGSPNVNPGYKLVKNAAYPAIADDYARMFKTLAALPADLFLGAHGAYFGMEEKYARLQKGELEAFVDREGYRTFVADKSAEFQAALKKQRSAGAR